MKNREDLRCYTGNTVFEVCRKGRGGAKHTSENNVRIRGWWHCTKGKDGIVHNVVRVNFSENIGDDGTRNTRPSSEPEL